MLHIEINKELINCAEYNKISKFKTYVLKKSSIYKITNCELLSKECEITMLCDSNDFLMKWWFILIALFYGIGNRVKIKDIELPDSKKINRHNIYDMIQYADSLVNQYEVYLWGGKTLPNSTIDVSTTNTIIVDRNKTYEALKYMHILTDENK